MKCEWKEYQLKDLAINYDKQRIPLSKMERLQRQGRYRYYGAQGIIDYVDDYIFDGEYLLVAEDGENLKSHKQPIAQVIDGKFWVNNHAHIIQGNELCNTKYLCYAINNLDISRYITGSAQPKLNQVNLNAIRLNIPDREIQDKIVYILESLDSKIINNNYISKNLSVLIQTIYQKRFTSKCQKMLSDICMYSKDRISVDDLTLDAYFSTENMLPNKAGVTTARSLPSTAQTTKCHIGDVLISNIRPYFKKILYCHREGGCSSDVLCFSPSSKKLSAFLYGVLYSDSFFDFMVAGSKGTKMPRGDKQQIMTYPIYVPTNDELDEYNAIAMPILDDIYRNTMENSNLSSLRDTLLPRLISGEVDVSSVEI